MIREDFMLVSNCHRARTFINPSLKGDFKYVCKRCLQECFLIDTNVEQMDIMENILSNGKELNPVKNDLTLIKHEL